MLKTGQGLKLTVFLLTDAGCEINGKCVDVGSSVVQSCRTLTCTEENLNGLRVLNIQPTKIRKFALVSSSLFDRP